MGSKDAEAHEAEGQIHKALSRPRTDKTSASFHLLLLSRYGL
jgi:hypothetical protein